VTVGTALPELTITPTGGAYLDPQTVLITTSVPGAKIHFTTNGSDPTESSQLYTAPLPIESSMSVKAIAAAEGYLDSAVATANFGIPTGQGMICLVTNLNDNGPGSLRAAIINANAEPGSVVTIASGAKGSIQLLTALPPVSAKTTIVLPANLTIVNPRATTDGQ
jgi:hypothetical protein